MPQIIPIVISALTTVGYTAAALVGASVGFGTALAIGGALIIGGAIAAKKVMSLFEVEMPKIDTDRSRQATVKSTTEPYKIIYGQTLVSGPIAFVGTANTDNKDLYYAIALAGHEVNAITDMHFDDVVIPNSEIGSGATAGGNVSGSGIFGPKNSKTIVKINKYLGTSTQTADSDLTAAFTGWTSAHTGKGIAYIVTKWTLDEDSQETWDKYTPQNIKALVQGLAVYDPRLDVGGYGDDPTNALYIAYDAAGPNSEQGQNPALCLADYLINADYGMGINPSKIDWNAVVTAANGCDASVSVPGGSEKRFTCNGVLFGTDSHRTNINKILSSMNGNLSYVNGKYVMRAGIYEAPTISLNEDDLISGLSIKTSLERGDRFNTIKGVFIDPSQNYKSTEFPEVQLADAVTRDNGEVLDKEIALNMTNSSYMAQRISNKLIQLSDQQKVVTFPANLSAMRVAVGDRVQVSIDELSWSNKVFQCLGWSFSEEGGVNLTLREDSSTSYADPAVGDYSTITATGDITPGFRGVPSPSGLSATAGLKNVELDWVNPPNNKDYESIYVYASPNGNFSSAVKIGETDGTQFVHDFANGIDSVSPGDTRYYWVRAIRNSKDAVTAGSFQIGSTYTIATIGTTDFTAIGASANTVGLKFTATGAGSGTGTATDDSVVSNLEPNADPNTTVFATVGRVEWSDVSGSANAPEDNATVGATVGTDLYDTDGITVLTQTDVKNSILAQDILLVEVETGDVLDLETGEDVDIQNLGDVAIYVSDQNAILNSSITSVSNSLSALQDVVVDLTTGVGEVYVQATPPVAGVGGVSDPIPDFSRWYDSDDNNHPYYWDGSAWQDLEDPRIGQNEADITSLESSLVTTNSNVSANASAISVLDTTVTNQGNSITSISSDVTALETTVNDPSTGVAANASGLSSLTTRVTTAEGTITSQSSDITTLQTDLSTAQGNITTNATGISGLDTRVTTAEGNITANASDITALETTVNDATTGVAATASGLSALTTRVTTAESDIDTNSSAIITLDASFTQDLEFRTKVKDETGGQLTTETGADVDLNILTDYVSGQSAATQALDVRTTANESSITTQASQITALQSTVNDPSTGVSATATGLSSLTTRVTTAEGSISTQAGQITVLQTDVGDNSASIETQANSIDGIEANYTVKIDNNGRIAGFGLASTLPTDTTDPAFSEFVVIADQFSIVDPASTALTPIQPFTVTSQKIFLGTDVQVDGDLLTTGTTISDVALQVGSGTSFFKASSDGIQLGNETFASAPFRVTAAGALTATSATVTGEINATSGTISSSIAIGTGDNIFKADSNGIYLGNATYASAPFKVSQAGALTADSATITGNVTADTFTLSSGATLTDTDDKISNTNNNAFFRYETTAGGDDVSAPDDTTFNTQFGRNPRTNDVLVVVNTASSPEVSTMYVYSGGAWVEKADFFTGDIIIDGTLTVTKLQGDVTEVYPLQIYATGGVSVPLALTTLAEFSIPATELSLTKRNFIQANVTYSASISSGGTSDITLWSTRIQRKSKGSSSTLIGTVVAISSESSVIQRIEISGNVTGLIDSSGSVDSTSDGSSTNGPGSVFAVYYDSVSNRTIIKVSSTNPIFSVSNNVYHNVDKFTSAGTWVEVGFTTYLSPYLPADGSISYQTLPITYGLGPTNTATDVRISAQRNTSASNITITFLRATGVIGNYA